MSKEFCVNKSSKEFKTVAKDFDISESFLESLIYNYRVEEGSPEVFPPVSYIQSQLEGIPEETDSSAIIDLWDRDYSNPITVQSYEEAKNVKARALKYFKDSSIKIIPNNTGGYRISVAKPIDKKYEEQLQKILDSSPRDEQGRLLAPNGKPTNLTERQYAQVRTRAFRNWFGDWLEPKTISKEIINEEIINPNQSWLDGSDVIKENGKYYFIDGFGTKKQISKEQYDLFKSGESVVLSKTKSIIQLKDDDYSKILDENGEPLVLYHRSNDNIVKFDINKSNHGGFWFSADSNYYYSTKAKRKYAIPVFLNIRRPNVVEHSLFERAIDGDSTIEGGLNNNRFDGWVTKNIIPAEFYGDESEENIVFAMAIEPNQIKSAEKNIGSFSREDNNIYHNKSLNDIKSIKSFLKSLKGYFYHQKSNSWNSEKEYKSLISQFRKRLYIPKLKANFQEEAKKALEEILQANGLQDVVEIKNNPNSTEIVINESNIKDYIEESSRILDLYEDSVEAQKVLDILNFLKGRLGVNYKVISAQYAKTRFGINSPTTNAFYANGTAYFIEGRKLTADIAAEEMLHPLVASIFKNNSTAFNELYEDAIKLYPKLRFQIEETYKGFSESIIKEEVVTQALSRAFKAERANNSKGNSVVELLKKFSQYIVNLFSKQKSFNFDNEVLTLDTLATLINSDVELNYEKLDKIIRYNQEQLQKLQSNEFKEKSTVVTSKESSTINKETFYSEREANQFIKDLKEYDDYSDNDIKVQYFEGTEELDEYWEVTYGKTDTINNNPVNYTLHSGGAIGSDTAWGEVGNQFGIGKLNHYYTGEKSSYNAPNGNVEISEEDYREGAVEAARAAKYNWGYQYNTMKDPRLIRNWAQVKYADAIFAIGSLVEPGEKVFPKQPNDTRVAVNTTVTGGTGYAVGMAILHNKPVYVYDQNRKRWYKNIDGKWSESEIPTLTPNFAGIGTRELTEDGKKAIEEVYKKTFSVPVVTPKEESTINLTEGYGNTAGLLDTDSRPFTIGDIQYNSVSQLKASEKLARLHAWVLERTSNHPNQEEVQAVLNQIEDFYDRVLEEKTLSKIDMYGNARIPSKEKDIQEIIDSFYTSDDSSSWKSVEQGILEIGRRESFRQNEKFRNLLLATKGKTIESKDIVFAESLSQIREEFLREREEMGFISSDPVTLSKADKEFLNESRRINTQIDNLRNSAIISEGDIIDLSHQIVHWISDYISSVQSGNIKVDSLNVDPTKLSRADIVRAVTPGFIIAEAKKYFISQANQPNFLIKKKVKEIITNWDALMLFGINEMLEVEGFSITGASGEVLENVNPDADNFNYSNNVEELMEMVGNAQEKWQIDLKTLDVLKSMSQLVRMGLLQCYLIDENGNPVESEFRIKQRVNTREATQSILKWGQGAQSLKELVTILKAKSINNRWLDSLINRLEDTSGKETDFQSQFWGVFYKHFQPYSVVTEDSDGKLKSIPINELPALKDAYTEIINKYKIQQHPLFIGESEINEDSLKKLNNLYNTLTTISNSIESLKELTAEDLDTLYSTIKDIGALLGYNYIAEEDVKQVLTDEKVLNNLTNLVKFTVENLNKVVGKKDYEPFGFKTPNSIRGSVRGFIKYFTDLLEDTAVSSFFENGSMYQSYLIPSYMTKLMSKFKTLEGKSFEEFLNTTYGQSEWFKKDGNWRSPWLRALASDPELRKVFSHKVQLHFNDSAYMENMNSIQYTLSVISEYISETSDMGQDCYSWFRVPILSNKSSSEFIRFKSYRTSSYKKNIVNDMMMIFNQELSRIQTVTLRNLDKKSPKYIKNFDSKGKQFNFLSFLNPYLQEGNTSELGTLIKKKIKGEELTSEETVQLTTLASEEINTHMENTANRILQQWKEDGVIEGCKKLKGLNDSNIEDILTNFIWNDALAAMNILELTITDVAFYKDAEDLQKRLAQIHAPGVRGNKDATDYKGNRVSDGQIRSIIIDDVENLKSNIIDNLTVVFDRKIQENPDNKEVWEALKENIIEQFKKVNLTDAQAYSCPTSYRKKALLFGKWSKEAEAVYERLLSKNYTYSDLETVFQPLKPFVYSQIVESTHVSEAPMTKMYTPIQYKNSEYLLILADAILQGENTGKPNMLRAIFEVMEDSARKNSTRGIDTVMFTSAVKSGLSGVIDLKPFMDRPNGTQEAIEYLNGTIYTDGTYNDDYVKATAVEDYCIQQELPAHFRDHEQVHGSQMRYGIIADLSKEDTYEVEGKQLSAEEFKQEYERTIAENIQYSISILEKELNLSGTTFERRLALSRILQREILSSPRYGADLYQACSLDENGQFRISLGDATQTKRVQQLLHSIIKNRVNKQTIPGGPIVQVSNFGTSRNLNIRFKKKDGGLLETRDKFSSDKDYLEYIRENQAGIAYLECFAPIYMKKLFENFVDSNGNIDIQAIEGLTDFEGNKIGKEFLKMVGYRIPTEDKYSMAPLKIVGFLPREAGEGLMMPAEITLLSGSDFDADKEYVMRKTVKLVKSKNRNKVIDNCFEIIKARRDKENKWSSNFESHVKSMIRECYDDPVAFNSKKHEEKELASIISYVFRRVGYKAYLPQSTRERNNNKIVDMSYEVLTHEDTASKLLNPGGFEDQKIEGYKVAAFKRFNGEIYWRTLEDIAKGKLYANSNGEISTTKVEGFDTGVDGLKNLCYTDKNLCFIDTQVQFYKQNVAAAVLLGSFAVHKTAHAILEENGILVDMGVCKGTIRLGNYVLDGKVPLDPQTNLAGEYIGKILGSLVASSADAAKDPVLNLMNINNLTVGVVTTAIRLGIPFKNVAMLLSSKVVEEVIDNYNRNSINKGTTFNSVIQEITKALKESLIVDDNSSLFTEGLSEEELIQGMINPTDEIKLKTLTMLSDFLTLSSIIKHPTFVTRLNSISQAVGPLYIDDIIMEYNLGNTSEYLSYEDGSQVSLGSLLYKHPILKELYKALDISTEVMKELPVASNAFRDVLYLIRSLGNKFTDTFYNRDILNKLSDFFNSYLLVKNNIVDASQADYYINTFPKEWVTLKEELMKKYTDNTFIQAIKLSTDKKLPVLTINTTGLDNKEIDLLKAGWSDLYKKDPEAAMHLFNYCFFRGGIGFNPKSFMSLLPNSMKELIPGFKDAYSTESSKANEFLDLFIRHNSDNYKIVPKLNLKKLAVNVTKDGVKLTKPDAISDSIYYFVSSGKLYRRVSAIEFKVVPSLGNKGQFLDFNGSVKFNSTSESTSAKEHIEESTPVQDGPKLNLMLKSIYGDRYERIKSNYSGKQISDKLGKQTTAFMESRLKELNINYNEETLNQLLKDLCS